MPVGGNDAPVRTVHRQGVDPCRVGRRDAEPDERAGRMLVDRILLPIRGHHRAERTAPRGHPGREQFHELIVLADPEVAKVQNRLAVETRIVRLGDDDDPGEAARHLLHGLAMGMVPIGSGVLGRVAVAPRLALLDRPLRQVRYAVHLVRHANAVPVHGRRLLERIGHVDRKRHALPHAKNRRRRIGKHAHHVLGHGVAKMVARGLDAEFGRRRLRRTREGSKTRWQGKARGSRPRQGEKAAAVHLKRRFH